MNVIKLRSMLEQFYIEDIGNGDLSGAFLFPESASGELNLMAKMDGIFCGKSIIQECMRIIDDQTTVSCYIADGERVEKGTILASAKGSIQSLLKSERVLLNLIQRMSGIATETSEVVERVKGTNARICDTRKTMPGLRMLDKYAVRAGGGFNHRFGLDDAVMLKDNHLAFAGSISRAIRKVREGLGHTVKIEVEIEKLEQLKEAVEARADIIMFDNCTPEEIMEWRQIVPDSIITEASGMITKDTISEYAKTGVDYISLGYLTHSVKAFDISANVSVHTN
ncbi:carboxylating nicotinate-nucleotide diphosphorylase [Sporosarcina sp. Marseille-Q4063]|uniref:carboxylating nicotinate-nucleotide diphosphorylase n=1 Tax=Sporosarcina sp. Marseille-Q4063 TaxID=2810514 RepID=UPI001BAE998C|nr:carboxylating nicotinate-nucleotide diphosphorylase [Sporosarcina sp. Marseille-Q4063]QUW20975.1 carboxylating nicotinate-nucleotide diphosphorylase [Sporosarcina sp. Marseille-Q4063]